MKTFSERQCPGSGLTCSLAQGEDGWVVALEGYGSLEGLDWPTASKVYTHPFVYFDPPAKVAEVVEDMDDEIESHGGVAVFDTEPLTEENISDRTAAAMIEIARIARAVKTRDFEWLNDRLAEIMALVAHERGVGNYLTQDDDGNDLDYPF